MNVEHLTLYLLWAAVLVNLVLTLRVFGWVKTMTGKIGAQPGTADELPIGSTAPGFRAWDLSGKRISEQRFAGQQVAYAFVSPNCTACRGLLPMVHRAAELAVAAGVKVVLVTDVRGPRAQEWLREIEREDGMSVTLPVLAAAGSQTSFIADYDGPGFFPYFLLVDGDATVRARGIIGMDRTEWRTTVQEWHTAAGQPSGEPASAGELAPAGELAAANGGVAAGTQ